MSNPSTILKTIGNPHRLAILEMLVNGECNVTTINKIVKVSQPALSQHLSKLKKSGLVGSRRQVREIFYHLKDANVIRIMGIAKEMSEAA